MLFFIGEKRKLNPELGSVNINMFLVVPRRDTYQLDITAQRRIFLNNIIEPINYRRGLVATGSENIQYLDKDKFGGNLRYGQSFEAF
ncbi:MAG: hypothetical protein JSV55_06055 [Deltaproteobacteria bacterium]|nr:MAG: hypothetical protein JSV55_06055 [Deltaproteobacteria bacterium]